ncbi:MAG: hypothetical protein ABJL44_03450 [Algibacter sp.]
MDYKPMFFNMENEWQDVVADIPVFKFKTASLNSSYDSPVSYQVRLLSNKKREPLLFFADIETTVCADGECKLANLKVFWNLLGNYVGYGVDPKLPLTKYEHDAFEEKDYAKLHQLLLDNNSILKRRKMSDLIDTVYVSKSDMFSNQVDAISGATKTEIKESVVKGGLYSCYTLWHIVHGDVNKKIKLYTDSIHTDKLNQYCLNTDYKDYQNYALKHIPKEKYGDHIKQILQIFKTNDGLTRAYVLKKIPDTIFSKQKVTTEIYNTFPEVDINTRTLLIKKIENTDFAAVEILSKYLRYMTKNQLKLYLEYLKNTSENINKKTISNLKRTSKDKNYPYNYMVKEYLNNRK